MFTECEHLWESWSKSVIKMSMSKLPSRTSWVTWASFTVEPWASFAARLRLDSILGLWPNHGDNPELILPTQMQSTQFVTMCLGWRMTQSQCTESKSARWSIPIIGWFTWIWDICWGTRPVYAGSEEIPPFECTKSAVDIAYKELIGLQEKQVKDRHIVQPSWILEETWWLIQLLQSITLNSMDVDGRLCKLQLKWQIRRMLKTGLDEMIRWWSEAHWGSNGAEQQPKSWFSGIAKVVQAMLQHQATNVPSKAVQSFDLIYRAIFCKDTNVANVLIGSATCKTIWGLGWSIDQWWDTKSSKVAEKGEVPGPSRFYGDTIKQWAAAEQGKDDAECFAKLADLCKTIFLTGDVPQAMKEGVLVLLPKTGSDEFRGITLLDVTYKLISLCMNEWAKQAIDYHDGIHRFWNGRGC